MRVLPVAGPIEMMTPDEFRQIMAINVEGVVSRHPGRFAEHEGTRAQMERWLFHYQHFFHHGFGWGGGRQRLLRV